MEDVIRARLKRPLTDFVGMLRTESVAAIRLAIEESRKERAVADMEKARQRTRRGPATKV